MKTAVGLSLAKAAYAANAVCAEAAEAVAAASTEWHASGAEWLRWQGSRSGCGDKVQGKLSFVTRRILWFMKVDGRYMIYRTNYSEWSL